MKLSMFRTRCSKTWTRDFGSAASVTAIASLSIPSAGDVKTPDSSLGLSDSTVMGGEELTVIPCKVIAQNRRDGLFDFFNMPIYFRMKIAVCYVLSGFLPSRDAL